MKHLVFISLLLATVFTFTACAGTDRRISNAPTNTDDTAEKTRPGLVKETIYTISSNGETVYNGNEIIVAGSINGKDIGEIGIINTDGILNLNIPKEIPDGQLDSRAGTNTLGGTLTMSPRIHPWKSDTDMLLLIYVSEDLGNYKEGWNYADMEHQMVSSTTGYKWILMEE
jgi:hypothetical protein